jgi:O-antigen/teichoic acid export membrane protein
LVLAVLGFIWILLLIWSADLVQLSFWGFTFFGRQYWTAVSIVPIIGLAYIFHAAYLLQLPGLYLLEKSALIPWIRGLGALSNILLNFLFIPTHGIIGAATATCISFILMAVFLFFINQRIFPVHYNWYKLFIIFFTIILVFLIQHKLELTSMEKSLLCLSFPVILTATKVVNPSQIRMIIKG